MEKKNTQAQNGAILTSVRPVQRQGCTRTKLRKLQRPAMKTLLKILGVLVVCVVLVLVIFRITGFGPHGRTPGLWLGGTVVTTPVSDWSFASEYFTLEIQTRTPYVLPHSVTAACITYMGQLYVGSIYEPGLQYPHGRNWNENVARDPHVRVKVGDHLYDATLVHVSDPSLVAAVLQAEQARYRGFRVPPGGSLQLFHVVQTSAPATTSRE